MIEQYLTPENIKMVLAAVAGYFGYKYLVKTDTKVESRRRAAAELASHYREMGLASVSNVLLDYSVGDYSGMAKKITSYYEKVTENGMEAETDSVFNKILNTKLQDAEFRATLTERLKA